MTLSMTGFGDAQLQDDGVAYALEIRSVNNRYLKTSIHLPDDFAFLEPDVERQLRTRITRGSVTVRMSVRKLTAEAALEINSAAIQQYVAQLQAAVEPSEQLTIDLSTLAALPGVCQPRELNEREREHSLALVSKLLDSALDKLIAMRAAEGCLLAEDLATHCKRIRTHLAAVCARAPQVVNEYRDRLLERVQELIARSNVRLAEEDLLKEVSVYADRSDISEEISRLAGHLDHFDTCLASSEPAGRKFEFIAQEMLREANTMGSKAGDVQIARDIIEIKSAIDRIKEQVQNAE